MFRPLTADRADLDHLERIETWIRARFDLRARDLVLVSQEVSGQPGFPPLETVVLFWTGGGLRHRIRLFKPAAEVTEADLPVAWLLPSLVDDGDADCC